MNYDRTSFSLLLTPYFPESSHVPAPSQLVERIICGIVRYTTKINGVNDQIVFGKVIERNDSGVHKATTALIY